MNRILNMLLPTTFPRAISPLPDSADRVHTANSGALVPNATTVIPITRGVIPSAEARREAPLTSHSAPTINKNIPKTNRITTVISKLR